MEGPIETFKELLQGSWTLQTRPKLHKVLGDTLGLRDWVMHDTPGGKGLHVGPLQAGRRDRGREGHPGWEGPGPTSFPPPAPPSHGGPTLGRGHAPGLTCAGSCLGRFNGTWIEACLDAQNPRQSHEEPQGRLRVSTQTLFGKQTQSLGQGGTHPPCRPTQGSILAPTTPRECPRVSSPTYPDLAKVPMTLTH